MQQIAIRLDTWSDPRFHTLVECSGWDAPRALGVLTMLWAHTRAAKEGPTLPKEELRSALAHAGDDIEKTMAFLIFSGYVQLQRNGKYIVYDNEAHFALKQKLQEAGARGGYQKHRVRTPKKKALSRVQAEPSKTARVWQAYSESYRHRYGVDPVRNVAVMGQLSRLVSYVGAEAPALATFYLNHQNSFYLKVQHSVGALLRDYSSLYTQMQRNVTVTEHDVTAHSRSGRLEAQLRRFGAR